MHLVPSPAGKRLRHTDIPVHRFLSITMRPVYLGTIFHTLKYQLRRPTSSRSLHITAFIVSERHNPPCARKNTLVLGSTHHDCGNSPPEEAILAVGLLFQEKYDSGVSNEDDDQGHEVEFGHGWPDSRPCY